MSTLTAIDILGLQGYVFGSNRLVDVISASWLVSWATGKEGLLEELGVASSVLVAGGGNAVLEFAELNKDAKRFAAEYTRQLHEQAPGLEATVAHWEYQPGCLAQGLTALQIELARSKTERVPNAPLLGISVTAPCRITGLPAEGVDLQEPSVPLAGRVLRLRNAGVRKAASDAWENYLPKNEVRTIFPSELDDLGRTYEESSYLGIVHVDGNGVGERIRNWLASCVRDGKDDEVVRSQYREWSSGLDQLSESALRCVVKRINDRTVWRHPPSGAEPWIEGDVPKLSFPLRHKGMVHLPLRPVLRGGDDLTFLCDGRIALDLAVSAVSGFAKPIPHIGDGKLGACAGVAIVPAHYPFYRAYALASQLCDSAKAKARGNGPGAQAIDWHIGSVRPNQTVERMRGEKYSRRGQKLTCRPYLLDGGSDLSWRWLTETLLACLRGPNWSRNKVKALEMLAREGRDSVKKALESWLSTSQMMLPSPIREDGYDGDRTPLIDAIELLDLHLSLDPSTPPSP